MSKPPAVVRGDYGVIIGLELAMLATKHGAPPAGQRWVMAIPGHGAEPIIFLPSAGSFGDEVFVLARANTPVLSPNGTGLTTFANNASRAAYTAAYNYMVALGYGAVCGLMGWSMGGLEALDWGEQNQAKVDSMYLFCPATDLDYFHNSGNYGWETDIAYSPWSQALTAEVVPGFNQVGRDAFVADSSGYTAPGSGWIVNPDGQKIVLNWTGKAAGKLTGVTLPGAPWEWYAPVGAVISQIGDWATVSAGHNPLAKAANYGWCPVHILHGNADATVPIAQTEAFIDAVDDPNVTMEVLPGWGHNPGSAVSPTEAVRRLIP